MNDDPADNRRFLLMPQRAWDMLLNIAPIPLAGIALLFSVQFVWLLCRLHFGQVPPEQFLPVRLVLDRLDLIDSAGMTVALGFSLCFLAHGLFRWRAKRRPANRGGFGHSGLLITTATIVVSVLAAFWFLDVRLSGRQPQISRSCVAASLSFGGAWAVAAGTAIILRRAGNRFEAICLLPPVVSVVVELLRYHTVADMVRASSELVEQTGKLMAYPTTTGILVLVTLCTLCGFPIALWAEKRLFNSSTRCVGIVCACLWALAAKSAVQMLWMKIPYY